MHPILYEIHLLDRKSTGKLPWKYSGSDFRNNERYFGSSKHPDFKQHLLESLRASAVEKVVCGCYPGFSIRQLREAESKWQKVEGHKTNPEYYNLSDSTHPVSDSAISRKRISDSIKKLGTSPFSKETHSVETLQKARETRVAKKWKNYYNPVTLERRIIATALESPPKGWIHGRHPRKQNPTPNGVNPGNTRRWEVWKNNEVIWSGESLRAWCDMTGVLGLRFSPKSYLHEKTRTKVSVYRIGREVIEDLRPTGLTSAQYADALGRSRAYVSTALRRGFYEIVEFDEYSAKEIPADR